MDIRSFRLKRFVTGRSTSSMLPVIFTIRNIHWLFNVSEPDTQGHPDLFLTFNWSFVLLWPFASYFFRKRDLFMKIRFNWPNYRVNLIGIKFQFIWKGHVDSRQNFCRNFCRSRTQIRTSPKCLNTKWPICRSHAFLINSIIFHGSFLQLQPWTRHKIQLMWYSYLKEPSIVNVWIFSISHWQISKRILAYADEIAHARKHSCFWIFQYSKLSLSVWYSITDTSILTDGAKGSYDYLS